MNDLGLGIVVSMKDAFSRNAYRIQSSMSALDQTVAAASVSMQRNLARIQKGTMMIGAGLAMLAVPTALVASTAATQKALGELASLGVKDLKALELAAQDFTNQWSGSSKAEFLTAAYDVRSALSGLTDEAVGKFAQMAALTGKATKATTAEMVGTFTTAYGIFKPIMADLGDIEWAQTFSGAMAQTVASFKTNGAQMAEAIKNIGAVAAASNVPLEEQLAILGQLQTTMPGSEAGTLYKAFIMKAAEAGDSLGLEFVDSAGQLKGVLDILDAVKEKFPDLSQAAAQVELKKAFGSDEAVKFLLQMSQGATTLKGNIDAVRRAMEQGTVVTLEMARAMNADIGARFVLLRQQVQNLFEILGATLLPVVTPVMKALSQFVLRMQAIAQRAPGLTRAVLTLAMVLGGLLAIAGGVTAVVGTIGLLVPAVQAGFVALSAGAASAAAAIGAWLAPVLAAIAVIVAGVYLLKRAWQSNFAGIRDIVGNAWTRVRLVFEGIRQLVTSLRNGTGQLSADVAEQLQSMGLLGFVTTVFRLYHRVRVYLAAVRDAFVGSFASVRETIEPTVRALFQAYRELAGAIAFVFQSLTAGDGVGAVDFWRAMGTAVGRTLGIMAKVAAVVWRFCVLPMIRLVRVLAVVIRVGFIVGRALTTAFIGGARFVWKFFLPLRLLVQALRHVFVVVRTLWGVLRGDVSVLDGLRRIGSSAGRLLVTPFLWARDVIIGVFRTLMALPGRLVPAAAIPARVFLWAMSTVWSTVSGIADRFGGLGRTFLSAMMAPFNSLPALFSGLWACLTGGVDAFIGGIFDRFSGLTNRVQVFADMARKALGWLFGKSEATVGSIGRIAAPEVATAPVMAPAPKAVAPLAALPLSVAPPPVASAPVLASAPQAAQAPPLTELPQPAVVRAAIPPQAPAVSWQALEHGFTRLLSRLNTLLEMALNRVRGMGAPIVRQAAPVAMAITMASSPALGLPAPAVQVSPQLSVAAPVVQSVPMPAIAPARPAPPVHLVAPVVQPAPPAVVPQAPPQPISSAIWGGVRTPAIPQPAVRPVMPSIRIEGEAIQAIRRAEAIAARVERAVRDPERELRQTAISVVNRETARIAPVRVEPLPGVNVRFDPASVIRDVAHETLAQKPSPPRPVEVDRRKAQLLGETRGSVGSSPGSNDAREDPRFERLLDALRVELRAVADRPIDVSVSTKLDGRQIAQSVYKDLRERKVRNYETM